MNLLSKSDVFAENKLFATLDDGALKVIIDNLPASCCRYDPVCRKLPTDLVDSAQKHVGRGARGRLAVACGEHRPPIPEDQIQVVEDAGRLGMQQAVHDCVQQDMGSAYDWVEKRRRRT